MDLNGLEAAAAERLEPAARDYVERGSDEATTRDDNIAAWTRLRLRPHVLHDGTRVDTTTTVLGVPVAAPVGIAPTAAHGLVHPRAELATATAAAATTTPMCVSMASSCTLREIADAAPGATLFAQLYLLRDRGRSRAMVDAAREAGCQAIVLSLDGAAVPYGSDRRAAQASVLGARVATLVDDYDAAVTADDLAAVRAWSGLPLVVKGVLRGDDALRCVDAGADAVYVSNHGGRMVDGCIDTATALAEISASLQGRAEVFVDGGIRSGVDVLRALALGARAVFLGRPVLWGLALRGDDGVRDLIATFRADLARAMAFCGATALADVTTDLVR